MTSPESPNRREFLKKLGGLAAGGVAVGLAVGPVSKALSENQDTKGKERGTRENMKQADEAPNAKESADMKDLNTTIEIEKKILAKLRDSDSITQDMQNGKIPEAVFAYSREHDEQMLRAGLSVPAGAAVGAVLGVIGNILEDGRLADSPEAKERERKSNLIWGSVFGVAMGGLNAAGVAFNQPNERHIKRAEGNVSAWLGTLTRSEKSELPAFITAVSRRIDELTARQKESTPTLSARR